MRNGEGGTKRKVAINKEIGADELSNDEEEGVGDAESCQILSEAEAFWKEQFSKVRVELIKLTRYMMLTIITQPVNQFKSAPPLKSKGTYTSHVNIYKKQANLCKAAAGSVKISGFFMPVSKPTQKLIEVLKIES